MPLVAERRAIRPIRRQRVEAVDHRENPRANRNVGAGHAARIPGAIPVLVMAAHDRHDGVRKIDKRQDVGADIDVALHLLELGLGQLAGLVEDVLGHGELPRVVQQRRRLDGLQRRLRRSRRARGRARAHRPARAARGCASRHLWRRSPSRASRRSTDTADRDARDAGAHRRGGRTTNAASGAAPRAAAAHDRRRAGSPGTSAARGRTKPTRPRSSSPTATGSARARQPPAIGRPCRGRWRSAIRPEFARKYTAVSASSGPINCTDRRLRMRERRHAREQEEHMAAGPDRRAQSSRC